MTELAGPYMYKPLNLNPIPPKNPIKTKQNNKKKPPTITKTPLN
jgi:hypothetical protein